MNFLNDVLHPRKWHLYNLPDFPEDRLKPYRVSQSAPLAIVIPIFCAEESEAFTVDDRRSQALEDYIVKSAVWALASWIESSDVQRYGCPVYLYIEKAHEDRIRKILTAHNVPESFIKVSDYSGLPEYSKSLSPMFDKSLHSHKYILSADADLFVMAKDRTEPLKIAEKLHTTDFSTIGVAERWPLKTPFLNSAAKYWIDRLFYLLEKDDFSEGTTQSVFPRWLDRVGDCGGERAKSVFERPNQTFIYPFASLWIIPTSLSDTEKIWFHHACNLLGDDEAVMSVYHAAHPDKVLWELTDLGIKHNLHLNEDAFMNKPSLFHFGDSFDRKFMTHIGALPRGFYD